MVWSRSWTPLRHHLPPVVFDEWRPGVDGVIDELRIEVNKLATLKLEVGKISNYMERSMVDGPSASPRVFATAPATKSASAPV